MLSNSTLLDFSINYIGDAELFTASNMKTMSHLFTLFLVREHCMNQSPRTVSASNLTLLLKTKKFVQSNYVQLLRKELTCY